MYSRRHETPCFVKNCIRQNLISTSPGHTQLVHCPQNLASYSGLIILTPLYKRHDRLFCFSGCASTLALFPDLSFKTSFRFCVCSNNSYRLDSHEYYRFKLCYTRRLPLVSIYPCYCGIFPSKCVSPDFGPCMIDFATVITAEIIRLFGFSLHKFMSYISKSWANLLSPLLALCLA